MFKNKIIYSKKKMLIILITVILTVFTSTNVTYAGMNPYRLFGEGNCTYLAYEYMNRFWNETFYTNKDAYKWKLLINKERNGYRVTQTENPEAGDIFIIPKSEYYPRGHVGVIMGMYILYEFKTNPLTNDRATPHYIVMESNMYATEKHYPLLLGNCRYRITTYPTYIFDNCNATFIKCTKDNL